MPKNNGVFVKHHFVLVRPGGGFLRDLAWPHCPSLPTTTASWRSRGPAFHLRRLLTHSPDRLTLHTPHCLGSSISGLEDASLEILGHVGQGGLLGESVDDLTVCVFSFEGSFWKKGSDLSRKCLSSKDLSGTRVEGHSFTGEETGAEKRK